MEDEKNLNDKNDDEKKLRHRHGQDGTKRRDVDDGNSRSQDDDDDNSRIKGDDDDWWCFQLEDIQIVTDTPTADSDGAQMMQLLVMGEELGTRSNEARNSGIWERRDEEHKTLETTQENEDRDEDQGDKMGRNHNISSCYLIYSLSLSLSLSCSLTYVLALS